MRIVCELAGFDPDAIREAAERLKRNDWPPIKVDISESAPLKAAA